MKMFITLYQTKLHQLPQKSIFLATLVETKKKVEGRMWDFFGTAACRPIVPLSTMSSPHSSPEAPRTT
jgi:hypothetical protein